MLRLVQVILESLDLLEEVGRVQYSVDSQLGHAAVGSFTVNHGVGYALAFMDPDDRQHTWLGYDPHPSVLRGHQLVRDDLLDEPALRILSGGEHEG